MAINWNKFSQYVSYLLIGLTIILFIYLFRIGVFTSEEAMTAFMSKLGWFAPVGFFIIQLIQVIIPIIPGGITIPIGSIMFGARNGFILNYTSIMLGSVINFYIARRYGGQIVKQIVGEKSYHRGLEWLSRGNKFDKFFLAAMAFPLAPDDLLCYVGGLSKMDFKRFFTIVAVTKPWTLLIFSYGTEALLRMFFKHF